MKVHLLKFPISATTKRFKKHKWDVQAIPDPGYCYLAFDKRNRLHIYINFHDPATHRRYNIQIGRYSLMVAILHSLMIRPIRKPTGFKMWVNKGIFDKMETMPENIPFKAAVEYNQAALSRLKEWMNIKLSPKEELAAQIQYQKIQDRQKSIDFIDPATTANAMTKLKYIL